MKSKIINIKHLEFTFSKGKLVVGIYSGDIVLITKATYKDKTGESTFEGVVICQQKGNNHLGDYVQNYCEHMFKPFVGTIQLEQ